MSLLSVVMSLLTVATRCCRAYSDQWHRLSQTPPHTHEHTHTCVCEWVKVRGTRGRLIVRGTETVCVCLQECVTLESTWLKCSKVNGALFELASTKLFSHCLKDMTNDLGNDAQMCYSLPPGPIINTVFLLCVCVCMVVSGKVDDCVCVCVFVCESISDIDAQPASNFQLCILTCPQGRTTHCIPGLIRMRGAIPQSIFTMVVKGVNSKDSKAAIINHTVYCPPQKNSD